jgi:hypothetical protein
VHFLHRVAHDVLPSTFVLLTTLPGAPFLLATLLLIAALGTAAVTR